MGNIYKEEFSIHDWKMGEVKLTSVVIDQDDFDALLESIKESQILGGEPRALEAFRAAKNIPFMARGNKTEQFFRRLGVATNYMSVIVRGQATAMMLNLAKMAQA